ncbi:MAG: Type secretion system protein [Verrucomicrobiales bacterium]|nr:Type secretion system protein [Verrucomicrobiales bacterium]MDB6129826.1 Type secretion system protein [Verrucomicrobiales bacterium]
MSETINYLHSETSTANGVEIGLLVKYLLMDAIKAGASDIHIEPWETTLVVRIRLNGVLQELVHLPLEYMEKISGRFKVLANLITYQNGLPQEGHAPADPELGGVEQRISIFPTTRGEKIVVRLFDPSNRSFDIHSLGFDPETVEVFLKMLTKPSGLILLTGPTGSGKTTAIYSALYHLVQRSGSTMSIATVEDPVEFSLPMISQAQTNAAQNFTYPIALRSLMRQDPQVIMVGEIRDPETAAIAVQAGLTGHLVISTIHSGSTAGVFARMINMNIEPFLLSSSIIGVLGVRLIRKNCTYCSQPYEPEAGLLALIPREMAETAHFRKGAGCEQCMQTGFSGRSSVTELLTVDAAFRDAVLQKLPTRALQQVAIQRGMQTMWQKGLHRVAIGESPLEEILRVISVDEA